MKAWKRGRRRAELPDDYARRAALSARGPLAPAFIKGSGALVVGFSVAGLTTLRDRARIRPGPAARRRRQQSARLVDRDRRRRQCDGLYRQMRAGPRALHRADAADCRRARRALQSREADPMRHRRSRRTRAPRPGAQSHPTNFNQANLALAGATAREALLQRASTRLGVPVDQLAVNDGVICVKADRSKKVGYGELVGGRPFGIAAQPGGQTKTPERVDRPRNAGAARRVPGDGHRPVRVRPQRARARHAARARRPAAGRRRHARQRRRELRQRDCPGVVKVVVKKNFVGVVAEKPWQAIQAAAKLKVDVDAGRRPAEPARASTTTCGTRNRRATRSS